MFAEKLREARVRAGLTQTQLGELINTDKYMICKFEKGCCLPNEQDLNIICKNLQTTPQKLEFPKVATPKTQVATHQKRKSSTSTYKLTVALNRCEFSQLTASNLKKCGYKNLQEFVKMAYEQLQNQLQILELEDTKQGG